MPNITENAADDINVRGDNLETQKVYQVRNLENLRKKEVTQQIITLTTIMF